MYTVLFHARWDKNKSAAADKIDMLVYIKVCKLIDRAEEGIKKNKTKRKLLLNSGEVQREMT